MKILLVILGVIALSGCGTDPYKSGERSGPNEDLIGDCGAGLDSGVKAQLSAELKNKGGYADAGFQKSLRAAIMNLVKELEIPPQDRAQTIQVMYDKYLNCIDKKSSKYEQKEKRREGLACRTACCKQHNCADDCPMTKVEGYPIPANDGVSCEEYDTTGWDCITYPNGYTWCGIMPKKVSYSKLRSCISGCSDI